MLRILVGLCVAGLLLSACNRQEQTTPPAEAPAAEAPAYEEPVVEVPVIEEPAVEQPAAEAPADTGVAPANESLDDLKARFERDIPGLTVEQIKPSPFSGLYEILTGGQVLYISADGRYIFQGQLYDRVAGVNLTEQARSVVNKKLLARFDDSKTIVFSPSKPKYTVTVFTDTSCGYCRKLHQEMAEINNLGIKVRYMLFPRAGPDSPDGKLLQSVWCAKNQQEAMNIAKSGGQVPEKTCANPIKEHMELAQKFGLNGTPMMVTNKGTVIPGYLEPAQLLARLEQDSKMSN